MKSRATVGQIDSTISLLAAAESPLQRQILHWQQELLRRPHSTGPEDTKSGKHVSSVLGGAYLAS